MARMVNCVKLGREAEGMDFPPYPGELGKRIYESVSKEAWAGWLKHQTMLVNENRLSLADPRARQYLKEQTEAYFFGAGAEHLIGDTLVKHQRLLIGVTLAVVITGIGLWLGHRYLRSRR